MKKEESIDYLKKYYNGNLSDAIEKLNNIDLPNLKLIRMDAKDIDKVFNKEIDTIYLNFSDPWPKTRHAKRRLTSDIFLKLYENTFNRWCRLHRLTHCSGTRRSRTRGGHRRQLGKLKRRGCKASREDNRQEGNICKG